MTFNTDGMSPIQVRVLKDALLAYAHQCRLKAGRSITNPTHAATLRVYANVAADMATEVHVEINKKSC